MILDLHFAHFPVADKVWRVVSTRFGNLASMLTNETEPTAPIVADDLAAFFLDENDYGVGMGEDDDNDYSSKDPLLDPLSSASRSFEAEDKRFSDPASYMLEVLNAYRSTACAGRLRPEEQA